MRNGAKPTRADHRDFDFIKTHKDHIIKKFGSLTPTFPSEYTTDAGLWMPNQEETDSVFNNPALPYGCTDYTQADIAADLWQKLFNPILLESITHANTNGGADIRDSMKAAVQLGWVGAFFNVRPQNGMDFFDAIRLAQMSGIPEKRSVSIGTPWFPSWEQAALDGHSVMLLPTHDEMVQIVQNPSAFSWHNHKGGGWDANASEPALLDKSWQGRSVGDKGILRFPRDTINAVMQIKGTIALTATKTVPVGIQTIDMALIERFESYLKTLLGIGYGHV